MDRAGKRATQLTPDEVRKIQRHVVLVKHVAVPDAATRLRRAYSQIIQTAERLVRSEGRSGELPAEEKCNTDDPNDKEGLR